LPTCSPLVKTADQLFDKAKENTESYEHSLGPLLQRYDELKGKASLNKDEQTELHGIIEKIVEIVPSAATEIDKYGRALDINRVKVTAFLNENKKFLAEKEFRAVEEITGRTLETLQNIDRLRQVINKGESTDIITGGGIAGTGGTSITRKSTDEEQKERLANLRELQEQLVKDAETLQDKYGTKLPDAVQKAVSAISSEFGAVKKVTENEQKYSIDWYNKQIEEVTAKLNKLAKSTKEFQDTTSQLDELKKQRDALQKTILGNGDPNVDPEAEKKAAEARKKALADQKKAVEDLKKLNRESGVINQSEIDKEIEATFEKYESLKKLAHGNREILKQIDEGFYKALELIREKYAQKELEAFEKTRTNFDKANREFFDTAVKQATTFLSRFEKILFGGEAKSSAEEIAQLNLQIERASGEKKFQLQQKALDKQRAAAIEVAIESGKSVAEVNAEFDRKDDELKHQHLQAQINMYFGYAQQVAGILSTIDDAKTQKENAELARDQKLNDKKKKNLEAQLKAGIISQQGYDRKVADLDAAQEKRQHEIAVRQFHRNQRMQIVQAVMSGALAVASTIAALPGPFDIATLGVARAIEIGLMIATTAAQIGVIASQKPPEFGRGGKTSGRSHTEGGMGVYDHTGKKQAELEGDEGIINKHSMRDRTRYTVSGTTSQIASFLNSRAGGVSWEPGAILRPSWMNHSPRPMNFAALRQAHQYAAGGQFQKAAAPTSTDESQLLLTSILLQLSSSVDSLNGQLSRGIVAKTFLTDQEAQQDRLNNIRDDATFKA
jgi:ribosomal protein L18